MKILALALLWVAGYVAMAQGALPWGKATSVPSLAAQSDVMLFYVADYSWSGAHTDYDMARRAADAYLAAHPTTPTYLVLGPEAYQTCDDVGLPVVPTGTGTAATVSIIGYGSNVSSLMKRAGCGTTTATLNLRDAASVYVQNALFQGFTVSASHLDAAACGFYGLENSTVFDLACSNAAPRSDHEVEFGNLDATGKDYGLAIYNLKAYDSVGVGKGALLTPTWSGTALTGVSVVSGGTKKYTQQYTRGQIIGPGIASCSSIPILSLGVTNTQQGKFDNLPTVNYGYVVGGTVTSGGNCTDTSDLYVLVQDGVPVSYGMKFTNLQMSHVWNLESTASAMYGEGWMPDSGSNTIIGEHTYTNQTVQILEEAIGNKHTNAFFDGPGAYGAAIYGRSGSFLNPVFGWDSQTYVGSTGYLFAANQNTYSGWTVSNSQCTSSSPSFVSVVDTAGIVRSSDTLPGISLQDIEACDGTNSIDWPTSVSTN